jgi:hypothetical protein
VALLPDQSPLAVQVVASLEAQMSWVVCPVATLAGVADIVTVGDGAGAGSLPPPPPPQPTSAKEAVNASSQARTDRFEFIATLRCLLILANPPDMPQKLPPRQRPRRLTPKGRHATTGYAHPLGLLPLETPHAGGLSIHLLP